MGDFALALWVTLGRDITSLNHCWDFSATSGISGFRCLSESSSYGFELHFVCDILSFRIHALTWSYPCWMYNLANGCSSWIMSLGMMEQQMYLAHLSFCKFSFFQFYMHTCACVNSTATKNGGALLLRGKGRGCHSWDLVEFLSLWRSGSSGSFWFWMPSLSCLLSMEGPTSNVRCSVVEALTLMSFLLVFWSTQRVWSWHWVRD